MIIRCARSRCCGMILFLMPHERTEHHEMLTMLIVEMDSFVFVHRCVSFSTKYTLTKMFYAYANGYITLDRNQIDRNPIENDIRLHIIT